MNNNYWSTIKNLVVEIVGCGYSWSYRRFRIGELFKILTEIFTHLYEDTIIPSIVMGSIVALGWYFVNYFNIGTFTITNSQIISGYILYFTVFTIQDILQFFFPKILDGNNSNE